MTTTDAASNILTPRLQVVAWEITRTCNLLCEHCRASAGNRVYADELSTQECFRVVDQILEVGNPILILTGGEPLERKDVFEIAGYATGKGMRVVMGTNGTLITDDIARGLKQAPVSRVGVSLDFPNATEQDRFRGQTGAYAAVMEGIRNAQRAGIEVQMNCTITKLNVHHLDALLALALDMGAVAFHPFLLVPTGRGKGLEPVELTPEEYERTLNWVFDKQQELGDRIMFKPTDAPHYMRIVAQRRKAGAIPNMPAQPPAHGHPGGHPGARGGHPANAMTRGCLAGTGFAFISHTGIVQGCGYFTVPAGDVRRQPFAEVWHTSPLFTELRDLSRLKGKCGDCEYKRVCGGCRARAYEATGDYLAAEPYCIYRPQARQQSLHGARG